MMKENTWAERSIQLVPTFARKFLNMDTICLPSTSYLPNPIFDVDM